MDLFYRETGKGDPLIILHGLFGSSDNWQTLAKRFGEHNKVYTIDQRNHGRSFHADKFDYLSLTNDLLSFFEYKNIDKANILGHSMGGKIAMKFTEQYPELVSKLIIVDIAPRYYPIHHQSIIDGLNSLKLDLYSTREEVDEKLSESIQSFTIRQFLLKNLFRLKTGQFGWKINLESISNNIGNVGQATIPKHIISNKTLFISGAFSDYINKDDINEIKKYFAHVSVVEIEKAGHWVHAENPEKFYTTVTDFLMKK